MRSVRNRTNMPKTIINSVNPKHKQMKRIYKISAFVLLTVFITLAGCKDDADNSQPYLSISAVAQTSPVDGKIIVLSSSEHGFNVIPDVGNSQLALVTYDLRSNRDWKVVFESGNEDGWLMAYPAEGSGDGKLRFCVKDNDDISDRTALAVLYFQDGTASDVQFVVKQEANQPYLTLTINGRVNATRSSSGRDGNVVKISVASNGDYFYTKSAGSSWFNLVETGKGQITLTVDPLPEDFDQELREGTLTFKGIGTHSHLEKAVKIVQSVVSIDGGTLITIEEVLEKYEGKVVEENLYIRGIVISDIDNKNIPANQMVVQDKSGKGMLFTFEDASGNTFKVGTEITVWLYDKEIRKAEVAEFTADNYVYDPAPDVGCDGVIKTITHLNHLEEHLNCLVKITNAEWMFPHGTYYPGDESGIYSVADAAPWRDKARMVRSTGGGAIRAYVLGGESITGGATFKHARLLPQGNGALTGIIMNRRDDFEGLNDIIVLRMRSLEDDQIPASGRGYEDIVEFVFPWEEIAGVVPITPNKGAGMLRSSMDDSWHASGSQTSGQIYNGYAYWRTDPTVQAGSGNTFIALNTAAMDGSNSANSVFASNYPFTDGTLKGEGWIVTFSAADVTANEEIVVGFATSSSATGPRDFVIDWGEPKYTDDAINWTQTFTGTFTTFAQYECTNWTPQLYAPEFMFALPAECNGKENIVLRLRVNGTRRANLGATNSTFASGGTNRLCGLVVSKRQK